MTDRTKTRNRSWYTPYQQDMDDIARRKQVKPWIVYRILGVFLLICMVLAAFTVSPFMGVPMVLVMIAGAFRK